MIKPEEKTLRAIESLEIGSPELFDELIDWFVQSREKETETVIYSTDSTERLFATGRVQELKYILKSIETSKEKLKIIKDKRF